MCLFTGMRERSLKAFAPADRVLRALKGGSNFRVCEWTRNSPVQGFIKKAREQCFPLVLLIMRHKLAPISLL